ncbi:MAG: hypothetical protein ACOC44_06255 [Promethearchaeia archaeon]
MILAEETFQYFGFFDAIESGLYFVIVGYYFLLFAYFLLMRFRVSKKLYWLFFSLLFLWLAAGRVFFIIYYFFVPEFDLSNAEIVENLMLYYRLATFCTWMGISMIMGVLGVLLFPPEANIGEQIEKEETDKFVLTPQLKILIRIILLIIPIVVGILVLFIPDEFLMDPDFVTKYNIDIELATFTIGDWSYPLGRLLLNFVLLPLLVAIIPIIYIYLAWKTFGVLRRSYALNALGFLIYFAGRISQGALTAIDAVHTAAVLSPLLILLSLLILVLANNIEQLK